MNDWQTRERFNARSNRVHWIAFRTLNCRGDEEIMQTESGRERMFRSQAAALAAIAAV